MTDQRPIPVHPLLLRMWQWESDGQGYRSCTARMVNALMRSVSSICAKVWHRVREKYLWVMLLTALMLGGVVSEALDMAGLANIARYIRLGVNAGGVLVCFMHIRALPDPLQPA